MEHIFGKTGKKFDVGKLIDFDGKTHDINVITKWDYENDFEQNPVIVDYYFGDYDKEDTDWYIERFIKRQETLKKSLNFLTDQLLINGDFMSPEEKKKLEETVQSLSEMIVTII